MGRHVARNAIRPYDGAAWAALASAIRSGNSGFREAFGSSQKEYFLTHPEEARFFAEEMTSYSGDVGAGIARAYDFSTIGTLVDLGGSEGNVIGSLLQSHPHLQGILVDLPDQVASAPAVLEHYGVADRCEVVGGNFFQGVPAGDAYLMRRTLHNWGDDDCVRILERAHQASKPGARVLIVEIMLDHPMLEYGGTFVDLMHVVIDEGGRQRTRDEFESIFERAGFRFVREYNVEPPPFSILEAVRV